MCLIPREKNIDRLSGNNALGLANQNWWHVIEILHYTGAFFATSLIRCMEFRGNAITHAITNIAAI